MKILIIEDDQEITRSLAINFKESGYTVDIANNGERGYLLAGTSESDLIILDYNLPDLNGRDIIKKLRQEKNHTPIIMLTVHSEISDKVDLLSLGADDYITKPFAFSELLARVKTILRRPRNRVGSILKFDNILLDTDKCSVTRAKEKISLSFKEFSLLEYFMVNPERVLSRREIMEHIWDENADPFSNTIEVHIMNLRKKLEQYGHNLIFTVPNRGYKLARQA